MDALEEDDGEVYIPIKQRRAMKFQAQQAAGMQQKAEKKRGLVAETSSEDASKPKKQSLLDQRAEMLANGSMVPLSKEEESKQEEVNILSSIDQNYKPLMSVKELAKGVEYTQSMERELYERRQLQSAHHQGLAAPPTGRQIPAPPVLFSYCCAPRPSYSASPAP